jgi:hypothetical protein
MENLLGPSTVLMRHHEWMNLKQEQKIIYVADILQFSVFWLERLLFVLVVFFLREVRSLRWAYKLY